MTTQRARKALEEALQRIEIRFRCNIPPSQVLAALESSTLPIAVDVDDFADKLLEALLDRGYDIRPMYRGPATKRQEL